MWSLGGATSECERFLLEQKDYRTIVRVSKRASFPRSEATKGQRGNHVPPRSPKFRYGREYSSIGGQGTSAGSKSRSYVSLPTEEQCHPRHRYRRRDEYTDYRGGDSHNTRWRCGCDSDGYPLWSCHKRGNGAESARIERTTSQKHKFSILNEDHFID